MEKQQQTQQTQQQPETDRPDSILEWTLAENHNSGSSDDIKQQTFDNDNKNQSIDNNNNDNNNNGNDSSNNAKPSFLPDSNPDQTKRTPSATSTPTPTSSLTKVKHGHDSIQSSPGEDVNVYQHQILQHEYRTFSIDGMMYRNRNVNHNVNHNGNVNGNHNVDHPHRNHSHHSSLVIPAFTQDYGATATSTTSTGTTNTTSNAIATSSSRSPSTSLTAFAQTRKLENEARLTPILKQNKTYVTRSNSAQAAESSNVTSTSASAYNAISNATNGELKKLLLSPHQHGLHGNGGGSGSGSGYNDYDDNQERNESTMKRIKQSNHTTSSEQDKNNSKNSMIFYIIYAFLNTMMSVPSLYGYASVIFNHDVFQPYISTLSKLVIWSSAVHQFTFVIVSSISFAKAEVQDAGLLFLSYMSHYLADRILNEGGSIEEVISTTIVTLGIATASLGAVLMLMGRFNCANAVSYLPLPVIGGYLAFIGYFCIVAGVGLCISKSMIDDSFVMDIQLLMDKQSFILAVPGLISGIIMTLVSRYAKNDIALPLTMIVIPGSFYFILYASGYTMEDAREYHWVGEETPPASIAALFDLFDFNQIRWDLVISRRCVTVWLGMVFVVSFSSCLDVAAISMEMGEPLNVNKELITVGLSNVVSGLMMGQTGSYIFSQTILTYRTGFHSRWVGFFCTLMYLFFVISKVNLLEIAPLFFLGATLIFIGVDLLYEWFIEVVHRMLISEYMVLLATFVAIQMVGIDGGIILGVIVAVVEYVISSSQLPSLRRVAKRSRAVWEPQHRRLLQNTVYDSRNPKIITLEITETVFFGSSLLLFSQICDEIGISATPTDLHDMILASPRHHSGPSPANMRKHKNGKNTLRSKKNRPRYVVLEMSQVANVDASAARSCFLQLAKMCSKNGIVLCAAGVNRRVDWILRSHDVSFTSEEEQIVKGLMLNPLETVSSPVPSGKLILFNSINECLELCENQLIYDFEQNNLVEPPKLGTSTSNPDLTSGQEEEEIKIQLSTIFGRILGMEGSNNKFLLESFDNGGSAAVEEIELSYGQEVFTIDEVADSFYVVLCGSVGICRADRHASRSTVRPNDRDRSNLTDTVSNIPVGGIFGYVDFAIQRRRSFNAVCSSVGTIVAKISHSTIDRLQRDDVALHHIIEKVLLQASLLELANIDVS